MKSDSKKRNQTLKAIWKETWVTGLLILGVLGFRSSVASHYKVPTGSMIPTILPGDRFFSNQLAYGLRVPFSELFLLGPDAPTPGDIIVFPSPIEPDIDLVKRAVAVGGDEMEMRDGELFINGHSLRTRFIGEEEGYLRFEERLGDVRYVTQLDSQAPWIRNFKYVVPEGHFFAMGDNRDHSGDSRVFGPVEYNKLRAKGVRFFYSLDQEAFFSPRLSRIGAPMYNKEDAAPSESVPSTHQ